MKRLIFSVAVLLGLSGCAVLHDPYYYPTARVVTAVPVYVTPSPRIIYQYEYWHWHRPYRHHHRHW